MLKSSGVKIVATLGPSITNEEKIEELINAGVSMFRVNSSHSTPDEHKNSIDLVRKVAKKLKKNTALGTFQHLLNLLKILKFNFNILQKKLME